MISNEVSRFGLKMNMCIQDMSLRFSEIEARTLFFRARLIMILPELPGDDKPSESMIQRESHSLKNDVNGIYSRKIDRISWL